MTEPAVFLIHGLGGTQYDLGSMHKRLKNAGFVTHSLTLPGHGTTPEDLVGVTAEDWLEAVRVKYHKVLAQHEEVHVMGMCMGSLLAIETVKRERHDRGRLIALAPPIYLDGWATPWYAFTRKALYHLPTVPSRMKIVEEDPFGIKNEQLRAIVKAKFARGENFHYGWVPLACVQQVDRLRAVVMKDLHKIEAPTLVIHAREDELTSLRSADYLIEKINGKKRAGKARMVVLEDSYHMICVDNDGNRRQKRAGVHWQQCPLLARRSLRRCGNDAGADAGAGRAGLHRSSAGGLRHALWARYSGLCLVPARPQPQQRLPCRQQRTDKAAAMVSGPRGRA